MSCNTHTCNWPGSQKVVCLTGYLADTHTGVGLAVARKYRSYTDSDAPLLVCATAHYAKCLDQVVHALTSERPSAVNCGTAGRSIAETLSVLEQRRSVDTRPLMHAGLRSLLDAGAVPPSAAVLPAQLDAIAAHIRSTAWSLDHYLPTDDCVSRESIETARVRPFDCLHSICWIT